MKDLRLLIWLTQLGLSAALPPACIIFAALWLQKRFGFGSWILVAAVLLGLYCAIDGFRYSLKTLEKLTRSKEKKDQPPPPAVGFNDHD